MKDCDWLDWIKMCAAISQKLVDTVSNTRMNAESKKKKKEKRERLPPKLFLSPVNLIYLAFY